METDGVISHPPDSRDPFPFLTGGLLRDFPETRKIL